MPGNTKTRTQMQVLFTKEEKAAIVAAAKKAGLIGVSTYIRMAALRAANADGFAVEKSNPRGGFAR